MLEGEIFSCGVSSRGLNCGCIDEVGAVRFLNEKKLTLSISLSCGIDLLIHCVNEFLYTS